MCPCSRLTRLHQCFFELPCAALRANFRRYYYQPSSKRSSWDPVAEAVAQDIKKVVLVPEHPTWLEIWDRRHQRCVEEKCKIVAWATCRAEHVPIVEGQK